MKFNQKKFREIGNDSEITKQIVQLAQIPQAYGGYHKALLHVHTPASHDYKLLPKPVDAPVDEHTRLFTAYGEGEVVEIAKSRGLFEHNQLTESYLKSMAKKIELFSSYKEFLGYLMIADKLSRNKIEVVYITDHNTVDGYPKLKSAISVLKKCWPDEAVVPQVQLGVEISCGDGVHVVGIIEASHGDEVRAFLKEFVLSPKAGTYLPSWDVIEKFHGYHCIGYVAHINTSVIFHSDYGSGAYRQHLVSQKNMQVVGVSELSKRKGLIRKLTGERKLHDVCVLLDEDSHELEKLATKAFWIKGQNINFTMLKSAIEDSDISIRYHRPSLPAVYIRSISVDGNGFLGKQNEKFNASFSTSLNCIIGGRGSGKSTLLDCVSFVLSQEFRDVNELKNVCAQGKILIAITVDNETYFVFFDPVMSDVHDDEFVRTYLYGKEHALQHRNSEESHLDVNKIRTITRQKIQIFAISGSSINIVTNKSKFFKRIFRSSYSINEMVKYASDSRVTSFIRTQLSNSKHTFPRVLPPRVETDQDLETAIQALENRTKKHQNDVEQIIEKFNSAAINMRLVYSQTPVQEVQLDWEQLISQDEFRGSRHWFNNYNLNMDSIVSFLEQVFDKYGLFQGYFKFVQNSWVDLAPMLAKVAIQISPGDVEHGIKRIDENNFESVLLLINSRIVRRARGNIYRKLDEYYRTLDNFDLYFDINSFEDNDGKPVFKSISQISLGQKVVALLDFVFRFGVIDRDDTPLLLDQPEDNLDSSYIYKHLVQALRFQKDNRQVIMVTHNSTLLTNSKPEQVIAVKSDNHHGWIDQTGYPTESEVILKIINVLEGGIDSFKHREFIYGEALRSENN